MKSIPYMSLTLLVLCAVLGCSKGTPTEVKGKVMLDGKPVSGAQVQLIPKTGPQSIHTGMTDESGSFVITEPGDSNTPIQPGTHVVLVSKITGGMGDAVNEVPDVYKDRSKSPLTAEVKSAQTELPPLELKSK